MYLFIIFILIFLIITIIYSLIKIHSLSYLQKIKKKYLSWLLAFIPFIILFLAFNLVNFLVIILHLSIFFIFITLIFKIMQKINHKEINNDLLVITTLIITTLYLALGSFMAYHVFEKSYTLYTKKELGTDNLRILAISDAHVGTTFNGEEFAQKMKQLTSIKSDLFVILGDFVDDDTEYRDMIKACQGLGLIKAQYGTYFIFGNHDKGYANYRNFKEKELREELIKNNVTILDDTVIDINAFITLIGRSDKSSQYRQSITDLASNIDRNKYIITLNHQPNDYANEQNNVDLVLSGHTHGGQLFPLGYVGLLMHANDEFYGLHKRGNTNFIVTSGISCWATTFKTGTKSEYIIIDIKKEA